MFYSKAYKNQIVNEFLLAGDKFMPDMHLKQPGFMKSLCKPEIQIIFIKMDLIELLWHDMAYEKSKDLAKRTESDKVLRVKAFKITSDPKYDGYQRGLASMEYKFFW